MDNTAIIRRINITLAEKGITRSQFYDGSGITSGQFSMWNKNKNGISKKSIEAISDFLGVNSEWLLTGEGQKEKPHVQMDTGLSDEQLSVLRLYDSLSEQDQKALLAVARSLAASRQDQDES